MEQIWWIWGLGGMLLLWIISLALMERWTRWRLLRRLVQAGSEEEGFANLLPDPRPEDQAALQVIKARRRRFLWKIWPETQFSFTAINEQSLDLIKEIAQVYYPGEDKPELKASLADLVALHNRVGERLQVWLETLPLRTIKDVELKTVLRYHEIYRKVKDHPGFLFLKRHHLDKVGRLAWALNNYANPWYWGRQAAYTGGKEALARLFMAKVAAIVGEEALRVYGRHHSSRTG
jgi:hypothetical protein